MVWIGLTGGIASGKSTVSGILKEAGAFIIDADTIAHDLMKRGKQAYLPVVNQFGKGILDRVGEIDRKKLGEIVFRSQDKLAALNKIVHPFVFEAAEQERSHIVSTYQRPVIIFDAALLIETHTHVKMDMVILVYVDPKTQIERLCNRDQLSVEQAKHRINMQMQLTQKVSFANEIIDNSCLSVDQIGEQVKMIHHWLCMAIDSFEKRRHSRRKT
jgi:dephospho-CoA kinase